MKTQKEQIKILQNQVRLRDAEISRLMHRVTFVEMTNNQTEAENCLLRGKHFIRWAIIRLFTKTK